MYINHKSLIIFIVSIFRLSVAEGQILQPIENDKEQILTNQYEELIIGSWIPEGSEFSDRNVFNNDGTMLEYSAEDATSHFNWYIDTSTTPSGTLLISSLRLQNVNDLSDISEFEIDTLTSEEMVLVYFNGIGLQRNRYFKK